MADDFFARANDYFEAKRSAPTAPPPSWDDERTKLVILSKITRNRHPDRAATLRAFRDGKPWDAEKAYALVSWLCWYTGGMGSIAAICELAEPSLAGMPSLSDAQFEELVTRMMADARRRCDENREIEARFLERGFAQARGKFEKLAAAATIAPKEGNQ